MIKHKSQQPSDFFIHKTLQSTKQFNFSSIIPVRQSKSLRQVDFQKHRYEKKTSNKNNKKIICLKQIIKTLQSNIKVIEINSDRLLFQLSKQIQKNQKKNYQLKFQVNKIKTLLKGRQSDIQMITIYYLNKKKLNQRSNKKAQLCDLKQASYKKIKTIKNSQNLCSMKEKATKQYCKQPISMTSTKTIKHKKQNPQMQQLQDQKCLEISQKCNSFNKLAVIKQKQSKYSSGNKSPLTMSPYKSTQKIPFYLKKTISFSQKSCQSNTFSKSFSRTINRQKQANSPKKENAYEKSIKFKKPSLKMLIA